MNEFLKNRDQINQSTRWLKENGYLSHPLQCKDWELYNVTRAIGQGDLLDMGADGSFVLHNAKNKKRVGIDLALVEGVNKAEGAEYHQGDLMATPFEDGTFDEIVSCSVIEHAVDLDTFAKETSRLLKKGGRLIVSFDYWPEPLDTSQIKLYSLDWSILCKEDVVRLLQVCRETDLALSGPMDWRVEEAVITPQYCSPANVSYTFGLLEFIKQ